MKITKQNIEELAQEIIAFLRKEHMDNDVSIYFNNKCINLNGEWNDLKSEWISTEEVKENESPLDYFKYVNPQHILSMSFEGDFYNFINSYGEDLQSFIDILDKYGLYYELGNLWNLTVAPDTISYDEIEYTDYSKDITPEPVSLYLHSRCEIPKELYNIMRKWYKLSEETGDGGSCVIGAGFLFTYKETYYFMGACSPYQGCISWEKHVDTIREMLFQVGATDITYKDGVMD